MAERVTYLLEPKNWLIVTVILIGGHADGLAGAGWGLLAAFFAAVLPTVFISYGVRSGRWADRNVGDRRPRLLVLAFIIASVATGLILLAVLGAPALLTDYLAFMLASVAALAAVTLVWKISIHCAVAADSTRRSSACAPDGNSGVIPRTLWMDCAKPVDSRHDMRITHHLLWIKCGRRKTRK